jgi:ComF family protein
MFSIREIILQFFLPLQCPCCEKFLEEGEKGFCKSCLSEIQWISPPFCSICGTPFPSREIECHPCGDCMVKKRYFTTARALGSYEGSLKRAIHQWKYEGKNILTPSFGKWMIEGFYKYWDTSFFDLLIPVPLHKKRLKERGFNQALLLVKELSRATGIPYKKRILFKKKQSIPQVDLNLVEREKSIRGSFDINRKEEIKGKRILLIDDVYTTGATVNECSKVLISAGAKRVDVLTLAHTIKNQ